MAAGQGFKTFTTGEVLTAADVNGYLMQGVLVFASEAARDAAITSPQEGQFAYTKDNNSLWYYTGSAWAASGATGDIEGVTAGVGISGGGTSGTVTITNSMATAIDAKGDLVAGTAADTFARLAVGSNDTVLTADSTTATGLKWATASAGSSNVAGKNAVLNSNFNIWQRGTSIAATGGSGVYTADRWSAYNAAYTISQQATSDTTNLPFISNCARVQRRAGETSTGGVNFVQPLESVNSKPFIGKVATLSFYARAGANYSSASSGLLVFLLGGTGTDQNPNNTYTGSSNIISQTATLTTTWQRFSYTSSTIATTVNELAVQLTSLGVGTAGAADYFEITGVQLEIASSATAYSPNTSTYETELAACQRYYQRYGGTNYMALGMGVYVATTVCRVFFGMPVTLRTAPTLSNSSAGNFGIFSGSGNDTASAISANSLDTSSAALDVTVTARTLGQAGMMNTMTNPTAFIAFSSEL